MTGGQDFFRRREKRGWGLRATRLTRARDAGVIDAPARRTRPKKLNKQRLSLCA